MLIVFHVPLPTAATHLCPLTHPRSCGPLLMPGGHLIGAEQRPAPNLLLVNVTDSLAGAPRVALVCVPAKSGSTSFYNWLYRSLADQHWPYQGSPWIQNTSSPRWHGLKGWAVRFKQLPLRQRRVLLRSTAVRRFAFHRHPIERALSGFNSKAACGHGDQSDHVGVVRRPHKLEGALQARASPPNGALRLSELRPAPHTHPAGAAASQAGAHGGAAARARLRAARESAVPDGARLGAPARGGGERKRGGAPPHQRPLPAAD